MGPEVKESSTIIPEEGMLAQNETTPGGESPPHSSPAWLDRLGMLASALCSIHCLLLPVAFPMLLAGGMAWLGNWLLEWWILGIAVLLAGFALSASYVRGHGRPWPLLLAGFGFLFLVVGFSWSSTWAIGLKVWGGLLIALAHLLNLLWSRQCTVPIRRSRSFRLRLIAVVLLVVVAGLYRAYQEAEARQIPRTKAELLMRVWQRSE